MPTTKGLKPKDRKLATTTKKNKLTANQWQNTPQQNQFMAYWLTPASETFSNAYRSALKAGYTSYYAANITKAKNAQNWITEYLQSTNMTNEHVIKAIQDVYMNPETYSNSRSPADTRLKSLELMMKARGMDNKQGNTTNILVQPILSSASVGATTAQQPAAPTPQPSHVDLIPE